MRHDWIFDVLSDLLAYADRNDLPLLASKVAAALDAARVELATQSDPPQEECLVKSPTDRSMH